MTSSFVGSVPTSQRQARPAAARLVVRAGPYDEELVKTAVSASLRALGFKLLARSPRLTLSKKRGLTDRLLQSSIATKGRGLLAMDESNATCGKRLDSIGVENTEDNRRAYRELLVTTPGLGDYISGAILFEETLYQSTSENKKFTDVLNSQNIIPGEGREYLWQRNRPGAV